MQTLIFFPGVVLRADSIIGLVPVISFFWILLSFFFHFFFLPRVSLMHAACLEADEADRDPRVWKLPPVLPANQLSQKLKAWLQKLLDETGSANREQASAVES